MSDDDFPRCPGWEYTDPRYDGSRRAFHVTEDEWRAHCAAIAKLRPCASGHLHDPAEFEETPQ